VSRDLAKDLGGLSDSPFGRRQTIVSDRLRRGGGDARWFKMHVKDESLNGNPSITVTTSEPRLNVSLFFRCDAGNQFEKCVVAAATGTDPSDGNVHMRGCWDVGQAQLDTVCRDTADDSGFVLIRVGTFTDVQSTECVTFDLRVAVTGGVIEPFGH
jgi:hypothetical protein